MKGLSAVLFALLLVMFMPVLHASAQQQTHIPFIVSTNEQIVNEQIVTFAASMTSIQSGNWHDASIWSGARVPTATDIVAIAAGHIVTVNGDTTVAGMQVDNGGELRFAPDQPATLNSSGNVIVYGKLTMQPASPSVIHTLHFVHVNEATYVGGGMSPLASDVGLWVMCVSDMVMGDSAPVPGMVMCDHHSPGGMLDIGGSPKTSWTHAADSIAQGATQITLVAAPAGWQVGDEISITPTEAPLTVGSQSWMGFDVATITAINGATVTINTSTSRAHPAVPNPWTNEVYTAEVLNLTRNVKISGTGNGEAAPADNGRAHIFIRSTQPQSIKYLETRHLGPRQPDGKHTLPTLGRYGVHFHHNGDGSRGSIVEGVVVRDNGTQAFVPHGSNGIVFRDTISYNTFGDAYWWDAPPCDHCGQREYANDPIDITIDHAVAALVRNDPAFRGTRLAGFTLKSGRNLSLTNSVAVGIQGNKDAAGFNWPEFGHASWLFEDNIAHNNKIDGIFGWQNDELTHIISRYVGYHNGEHGIDHGAYGNVYQYIDITLIGNGNDDINARAASTMVLRPDGYGQVFERARLSGTFRIGEHTQNFKVPTLVKDCVLTGVVVDEDINPGVVDNKDKPGRIDFVNCRKPDGSNLEPGDFEMFEPQPGSVFRVQRPDGTAWQITGESVVSTIAPFYALGEPSPTAVPTNTPMPTDTPMTTATPMPTDTPPTTATPTPAAGFMQAHWRLDETGGTRYDGYSNNHLSDPKGVGSALGVAGNAADFNGSQAQVLSIANNAALQTGDVTFYAAMWVKADALAGSNRWILSKWSNNGWGEFILRYNAAANRFEWIWYTSKRSDVRLLADNLGAPSTNTWYFIEVWRDAATDTAGIAVNRGADNMVAGVTGGVADNQSLEIGGDSSVTQFWDGQVDEIRYYKGSIPSTAERDAFYNGVQ